MRVVFALFLLLCSVTVLADDHARLYQSAGWPEQRAHFGEALKAAQQRYQASLAAGGLPGAGEQQRPALRAGGHGAARLAALRMSLADPQPALQFFESPLGRRIIAAETWATARDQLAAHANGHRPGRGRRHPAPADSPSGPGPAGHCRRRRGQPGAGLPVAADSLSSMVPGLFGGEQAQMLLCRASASV